MPTNQETLDFVADALFKQGKPAIERIINKGCPDIVCRYHTNDGLKCAVGHLIDDSEYTPDLEGLGAENTKVANLLLKKGYHIYFLSELQECHDSAAHHMIAHGGNDGDFLNHLDEYLCELAEKTGLTYHRKTTIPNESQPSIEVDRDKSSDNQ